MTKNQTTKNKPAKIIFCFLVFLFALSSQAMVSMVFATTETTDEAEIVYNQVNSRVEAYFAAADASYSDTNYNMLTVISAFSDYSVSWYEKPAGYTFSFDEEASEIFFEDADTGTTWSDTVSDQEYTVYNLIPYHTYTYTVKDTSGNVIDSGTIQATGALRMIYLEGIHNCRDIGGWSTSDGTIQYGLLYRGSAGQYTNVSNQTTVYATESDINYLLNACGVLCEIDLRPQSESLGDESFLGTEVQYYRYGLVNGAYIAAVNLSGSLYPTTAAALTQIMQNAVLDIPTYVHCQAGADRTGAVFYILEALLGMSQSDCDKDYELTCLYYGADYTDRTRNGSGWCNLVDYINSFPGDTLQERATVWCISAGIDENLIQSFQSAMTDTGETEADDDASESYEGDWSAYSPKKSNVKKIIIIVLGAYIVIINVISYLAMWWDYKRRHHRSKRFSNRALIGMAVAGGSAGILIGMYKYKRKWDKKEFARGVPIILVAELIIFIVVIFFCIR